MGSRHLPDPNRVRVPPLPEFMVLTDRDDGTLWVLSHDITGEYIAINDEGLLKNPAVSSTIRRTEFHVYGPFDGPIVPDRPTNPYGQAEAQKRLLVRGGYLGYEATEPECEQGRVMTRRLVSRILREIIVPTTWRTFADENGHLPSDRDVLGWEKKDLP